jgi:hypothetical protein
MTKMTAQCPPPPPPHRQGELAHRLIKKFYQSTNKKDPAGQLAKQERRHTRVRRQHDVYMGSDDQDKGDTDVPDNCSAWIPPHLHHQLSDSLSNTFNLAEFLQSSPEDPAFHVHFLIFRLRNQLRRIQ